MTRRQSSTAWARTRRHGLPDQFVLIGIVTARSQAARKDFDMTTEPAVFPYRRARRARFAARLVSGRRLHRILNPIPTRHWIILHAFSAAAHRHRLARSHAACPAVLQRSAAGGESHEVGAEVDVGDGAFGARRVAVELVLVGPPVFVRDLAGCSAAHQ
jgi:hypothetical protein